MRKGIPGAKRSGFPGLRMPLLSDEEFRAHVTASHTGLGESATWMRWTNVGSGWPLRSRYTTKFVRNQNRTTPKKVKSC